MILAGNRFLYTFSFAFALEYGLQAAMDVAFFY